MTSEYWWLVSWLLMHAALKLIPLPSADPSAP